MTPDMNEDIFRILQQIIDRVMADGGLPPGSSFSGYAILAGPGGSPAMIRIQSGETGGISPEVVEASRFFNAINRPLPLSAAIEKSVIAWTA